MGLICVPVLAWPVTVTSAGNSANLQVQYEEPTTSSTELGTTVPLDDLSDTHVTFDRGGGEVECAREPATVPAGGGIVMTICSVPANRGEEFDVTIRAYATYDDVNSSDPIDPVIHHIDRRPPVNVK